MKFLLDESADYGIARYLTRTGHDVTTIVRDYPRSHTDREVLTTATREGRTVITSDRDFGELVVRHGMKHAGIILLRLESDDLAVVLDWLDRILSEHADELGSLIVVTDKGIRIRHAGPL